MKYVLLFAETEEFARDLEAMGAAEREHAYQRVTEWMATHAGQIRGGNRLQAPETATTVRLGRGDPVITDGPFVEGKEVVSGYTVRTTTAPSWRSCGGRSSPPTTSGCA
jgi:hypothetical protein